jgi:uncharacterized protein YxjI
MSYPLTLRFKRIAIARQVSVEDNGGMLLMYVKQKVLKLREAITVFADREQSRPLYHIKADRIIDFSAAYHVTDASGQLIGTIKQKGMRSIWRTRYSIMRGDTAVFEMREENPWAKVADSFLGEIPVLGILTNYLFHPRYAVSTPDGTAVVRIRKQPSLFEALFEVTRENVPLSTEDERLVLIGTVATMMFEKNRG